MAKGIIYVMTTIVDGLVKIGKTNSNGFDQRMRTLEHNGYCNVTGLKRIFAIEVDDYDDKEDMLHTIFSKSQVGNTELFSVDVNLVRQLLSSFDGKMIYPKNETKSDVFDDTTSVIDDQKSSKAIKSPIKMIEMCGLRVGDKVNLKNRPDVVAEVVDDRTLRYDGEEYSITACANIIYERVLKKERPNSAATLLFESEGKSLVELRELNGF